MNSILLAEQLAHARKQVAESRVKRAAGINGIELQDMELSQSRIDQFKKLLPEAIPPAFGPNGNMRDVNGHWRKKEHRPQNKALPAPTGAVVK